MNWSRDDIEFLEVNWPNMSASEIAMKLGSGLTRSAVIGKANRLGLSKLRAKPSEPRKIGTP